MVSLYMCPPLPQNIHGHIEAASVKLLQHGADEDGQWSVHAMGTPRRGAFDIGAGR